MFETNKSNNFDLLRLAAAIQVFLYHSLNHFNILDHYPIFSNFLNQIPGVPIFFFISGFLITASYNRNKGNLKVFFYNRAFRIFPALWVCLLFTTLLLFLFNEIEWKNPSFYGWFIAQATILQYYTPDFLRSWGIGNPNGSLWSIVVELQFYMVLPFLCMLLNKQKSNQRINLVLLMLFAGSFFLSFYLNTHIGINSSFDLKSAENQQIMFIFKIIATSVIWNLFFFVIGIFVYYNFEKVKFIFENKALLWITIYGLFFSYFGLYKAYYFNPYYYTTDALNNFFAFIALLLLAVTTFAIAFSFNKLSEKILKGNDISYGIYIYHMPIINTVLALNIHGSYSKLLISSIIVINLALFSWFFIEKRALKFKKKSI